MTKIEMHAKILATELNGDIQANAKLIEDRTKELITEAVNIVRAHPGSDDKSLLKEYGSVLNKSKTKYLVKRQYEIGATEETEE